MKTRRSCWRVVEIVIVIGLFFSTSCAYLQDRGNDCLDIVDVGVTVSKEPQFSLYAGFLNLLSLGYSNVDKGTIVGIGGRDVGAIPMRQNAWGVLLYGQEQFAYAGGFNPADPNSPEPWKVGILGLAEGPPPPPGQIANCPKLLHLGWLGLTLNCRFGELADFILGFTTLDIMNDDMANRTSNKTSSITVDEKRNI